MLVRPKAGILDPQGQAVERALPALGFAGVSNVHVGRLIELEVEDPDAAAGDVRAAAGQPADRGLRDRAAIHGVAGATPGEVRRRPLPRLLRRRRRAAGRAARRRGGAAVARRPRPAGRRRGRRPRRLLLRRLPARRRDRPLRAGDGGGRRVRPRRRARARDLQRLPGPVRGRPAAGRAAAQRVAEVRLPPGRARGRATPTRRSRARATTGERLSIPVKHTTGRYYAPDDSSPAGGRRSGAAALRARRRTRTARCDDIAGVCNERRQRVRADAPPRARRRPADGLDRRAADLRVDASACRAAASLV